MARSRGGEPRSNTLENLPKPARTFDLTVGDEKRQIVMSYGLFTEIMKVVPSPEQITELVVSDPYLREYVVRRMLTPGKVASDDDLVDTFSLDIDIFELDALVAWVAEHVLHFFMQSAAKTAAIGGKYAKPLEAIQSNLSQPGAAN